MSASTAGAEYLPEKLSLESLREATQTVFGEGSARAKIMFVGEEPQAGDLDGASVLDIRAPDGEARRREMAMFLADLKAIARMVSRAT